MHPIAMPDALQMADNRHEDAAVLVRRNAARPRTMAACGTVRYSIAGGGLPDHALAVRCAEEDRILLTKNRYLATTVIGTPVVLLPGDGITQLTRSDNQNGPKLASLNPKLPFHAFCSRLDFIAHVGSLGRSP